MTAMPPIRAALVALVLLSGCGAVGAVSDASARMDAYTLSALSPGSGATGGRRHLVVELPTASGALATDRILIKPLPFQAQYLPDGRWSEPTPALLQTLLVTSFQNTGGFRLVGRTGAGLMPDFTLMTELQAFQAEPTGTAAAPLAVKVSVMMTLIRESDRRIVATNRFASTVTVASDKTLDLVAGFDAALQIILQEAVQWTRAQAG
jgi:cholesterol transport system auxiliary component